MTKKQRDRALLQFGVKAPSRAQNLNYLIDYLEESNNTIRLITMHEYPTSTELFAFVVIDSDMGADGLKTIKINHLIASVLGLRLTKNGGFLLASTTSALLEYVKFKTGINSIKLIVL